MDKRRRNRKTGAAAALRNDLSRRQAINRDNPRRNRIGTLKVTIGVGDPQGRQFEELDVTVDTGSTYTAVPRAMLQRLGIPVESSLPSETTDGRIVPVDVGEATIRLQGLQFHTPVIFAEENEPSLLGAGRPRCKPPGGTTDTHQPATPLANSPLARLQRSSPAGQDHLQQRTKHKQQFLCKAAPAQEPKTGHPIVLKNRDRGYKYEL